MTYCIILYHGLKAKHILVKLIKKQEEQSHMHAKILKPINLSFSLCVFFSSREVIVYDL